MATSSQYRLEAIILQQLASNSNSNSNSAEKFYL